MAPVYPNLKRVESWRATESSADITFRGCLELWSKNSRQKMHLALDCAQIQLKNTECSDGLDGMKYP
jgi:hypothetical protein